MKIALVLNHASGSALQGDVLDEVRRGFAEAGCEVRDFALAPGTDLKTLLRSAIEWKPDAVVVGGGDGTLSSAAGVLKGGTIPMGVLPLGTFNHFARDLGIPLEVPAAIAAIVGGRHTAIDVGEVNDRIFINNSSLGIYPRIVRRRDALRGRLGLAKGKLWAFAWATLTALRRKAYLDADVCVDGKTQRIRSPFVFIGNNEYTMEGFGAGRRERLDGGTLSVYLTTRGRGSLVMLGLRALLGLLHEDDDFKSFAAQTLEVHSRHARLLVAFDGEVEAMQTPLTYRIHRAALCVLVPAAKAEEAKA